MLKKLLSHFNTNNKDRISEEIVNEDKYKNINTCIKDIENLLKITCPKIQSVACIYDSYMPEYGQNMVQAQKILCVDMIPKDAKFCASYYMDNIGTIILGKKLPERNYTDDSLVFKDLTNAEKLFFISHELRHVWQKRYAAEKYYKINAIEYEVIDDISEVDADAFAMSYVLSAHSPFTHKDMPTLSEEICLQATADNGKRWDKAAEISDEYGLDSTSKIEEMKSNADNDRINNLITIMKLNGMI